MRGSPAAGRHERGMLCATADQLAMIPAVRLTRNSARFSGESCKGRDKDGSVGVVFMGFSGFCRDRRCEVERRLKAVLSERWTR